MVIGLMAVFFFRQYPRYDYIDYGVYNSYAHSIVEDGNLNISDELYELRKHRGEPVIQTPTHYDPDYHSNGSAVLFAPFLVLGKSLSSLISTLSGNIQPYLDLPWPVGEKKYFEDLFIGICYFIFGVIGFYQILIFCFQGLSKSEKIFLSAVMIWSTPFYMYFIHYPGNMNIIILPILTTLYKKLYDNQFKLNDKEFFHFTLILAIGFIIKVDVLFVAVFFPIILWKSKLDYKKQFATLSAISALVIAFLINRFIQYGELHLGYGGVSSSFIPVEMLFTPYSGLFFTCPIFIFLIIFYFTSKRRSWVLTALLLSPLVKFIVISFAFDSGIDFGWRDVIGNIFIWSLILVHTYRNHLYRKLFLVLCLVSTLWTMFISIYYNHLPFGESYQYYFNVFREAVWILPSYSLVSIQAFHFSWLRLILFFFSVVILFGVYRKRTQIIKFFPAIFMSVYLAITILNFINKNNNSIYDDAIVTDEIKTWYSIENK